MKQFSRFDVLLQIRAPEFLTEALDRAADKQLTSRSDYIRGAILERLKLTALTAPLGPGLRMTTDKTESVQRGRPFEPGVSGNPNGRPRGSRNKTTLALESLLDGQATALTQKAIDLALAGDMAAAALSRPHPIPTQGPAGYVHTAADHQCARCRKDRLGCADSSRCWRAYAG